MASEQQWKIPPIVQELAADVQTPPSQYVVGEQDRPDLVGAVMSEPIPLVDLSRLSVASDDPYPDEVTKLRSALQSWGLFLAVGHGMEPSFLAETMNVTKGFFKLPMEEKQKYSNRVNGREFKLEGYGNDIVVSENQTLDWCDRFYIIVEPESQKVHSLWPMQPPTFRYICAFNLDHVDLHRNSSRTNKVSIEAWQEPWPPATRWASGLAAEAGCVLAGRGGGGEVGSRRRRGGGLTTAALGGGGELRARGGGEEVGSRRRSGGRLTTTALGGGGELWAHGGGGEAGSRRRPGGGLTTTALVLSASPLPRHVVSLTDGEEVGSNTLREFTARCREIVTLILANMAKLVGLHERYFVDMLDKEGVTYARLNYYPHCPKPDRVFGMKAHSDATVITVVLVDDTVSGLQVQGGDGVWYDVPIVPNALLVNVGDVMEIMSNGLLKSPVHRVVTNLERERLSVVMFYSMEPEKEIEPAPELVDEERPRRYRKTNTKDYIADLFETLARGARAIDRVKI
ncbi:hypothetical protein PR202_ga17979 [Eleusine coracana subsp. coracana]|uniref:Fe2OG dioxygenase domain-containing protein n=1 Tax=Eleusine coracana subsp. coracana TaxID=191504 RepID=A0AAV5CS82_ELECO|nr:hypothetical protein PR202_ga17979 [Eleusine coracana subsp. coracana]